MKKKKKKYIGCIFVFLIFPALSNMLTFQTSGKINDNTSIAIIFATGGLGDKGFNDAAYQGLVQANTTYTGQFNFTYIEPSTNDEFAAIQQTLASEGYDLIICVGFIQANSLDQTALMYPDQRFTLIDSVVNRPNVSSITFKEQEGSFLVGAMAAMITQTNKIGFFGGMNLPLINKFLAGYEQGAMLMNSGTDLTVTFTPNASNPFGDASSGRRVSERLYSEGNDIVYTAAGVSGHGVIQTASDFSDVYAIGVDQDQDYLNPGKVLCSMIKKVDSAVFDAIEGIIQGTWISGHTELGLAEDGVDISPMTYTNDLKTGYFSYKGINQTRWEWIADIKQNITDGTIIVSDTPSFTPYFPSVAMIFAPGGINTDPLNSIGYNGLEEVINNYYGSFLYKYVEPATTAEIQMYQQNLAAEGHDLIICYGFLQTAYLDVLSNLYPSQRFILIDDVLIKPNVASFTFKEQEGSFLVGAMAAMTTQSNKVGFLGGMDIYLTNKFLAGYQQGIKYIRDDITTTVAYSPDPAYPWTDIPGGKLVGSQLYDQGHDIVYAAAGVTGLGVMEAASERTGFYAVGVDYDQDDLFPGKILCSMLKKFDTAVYKVIEDFLHGLWSAGNFELGLAEDGVDISPMMYTAAIRDGLFTVDSVTKTRWDFISDIKQMIIAGILSVTDTPDWSSLSMFVPTLSTTTTTVASETTVTTTTSKIKPTTGDETTPTSTITSWPSFIPLFVLSFLIIIRKRRRR